MIDTEKSRNEYEENIRRRHQRLKIFVDTHIHDEEVRRYVKETEMVKRFMISDQSEPCIDSCDRRLTNNMQDHKTLTNQRSDDVCSVTSSCDCPAHVHDKEIPLELVPQPQEDGEFSHFDF